MNVDRLAAVRDEAHDDGLRGATGSRLGRHSPRREIRVGQVVHVPARGLGIGWLLGATVVALEHRVGTTWASVRTRAGRRPEVRSVDASRLEPAVAAIPEAAYAVGANVELHWRGKWTSARVAAHAHGRAKSGPGAVDYFVTGGGVVRRVGWRRLRTSGAAAPARGTTRKTPARALTDPPDRVEEAGLQEPIRALRGGLRA